MLFNDGEDVARANFVACSHVDFGDFSSLFGGDLVFHLHRLKHHNCIANGNCLTHFDHYFDDGALHWCSYSTACGATACATGLRGLQMLGATPGQVSQAPAVIRRQQPALVLGMGGFAAGPGGLAARLSGRPLLIHEQNAAPGLTNRLLHPPTAALRAAALSGDADLTRAAERLFPATPGYRHPPVRPDDADPAP